MNVTQQIEPVRRTFFDVLRGNLKTANRLTFVHRFIYIGEHTFLDAPGTSIGDCMEKTIQKVNTEYNEEQLSGLLLCYPKYFCHIVEGSEDSIVKHLILLTTNDTYAKQLGRMKILICYHHINQVEISTSNIISGEIKPSSSTTLVSGIESVIIQEPIRASAPSFAVDNYQEFLPEYGLLEYLLGTHYTQDVQHYINIFGRVPALDSYKDKIWPVPCDFVPYNIFDKPYDPVTDLPISAEEVADMLEIE